MATLASPRYAPDLERTPRPSAPRLVGSVTGQEVPVARCVYQPSRESAPVAIAASVGMILAGLAALATLNVVAQHKDAPRLTVVAMRDLDVTPPPPPPKRLDKPVQQPPQVFIPKPMIELPSPAPTQIALDLPQPPSAPIVAAARIVAPAGPPVTVAPIASSDPVEGGDLASQGLSATPPAYPIDARRRREQGTVKLMALVGPDGKVTDIQLATSSGSQALDRAALAAVKRWRWLPQKKAGQPVAVRGFVTIPFVLTH